jgi:hypothetical protein
MTPSGNPASRRMFMTTQFECSAVVAGFHTTTLPISAGAVGKLPPIAVKLNGVTASTNPSRLRYSTWFHMPGFELGCCARICAA